MLQDSLKDDSVQVEQTYFMSDKQQLPAVVTVVFILDDKYCFIKKMLVLSILPTK